MKEEYIKRYESARESLLNYADQGLGFLSNIGILAAALLIVATFSPEFIPNTWLTRLIVSILLSIIPINFWSGFIEIHRAIKQSKNAIIEIAEEAAPNHPAVKNLRDDFNRSSLNRMIQFISAVLLTIVVVIIIIEIWYTYLKTV